MRHLALTLLLLAATLAGCASHDQPMLAEIYNPAAQHHGPDRNPVIVIPGILGSRLVDDDSGLLVWGAFSGEYAAPNRPDTARLVALPMTPDRPLRDLQTTVRPDGALETVNVRLLRVPVEIAAYADILQTLGVGGYRDQQLAEADAIDYGTDHYTCFQFSYDWRRDNVETAARLYQYIQQKHTEIQALYERDYGIKNADVRFDIVAHSMGGLVTRYMLRYGDDDLPLDGPLPEPNWKGARYIDRVILVGTPNAGSALSVIQLNHGADLPLWWHDYPPAILGTMPAVYQLMPRPRHHAYLDDATRKPILNIYDPELWQRLQWGLMNPDQDRILQWLLPEATTREQRLAIARNHLAKCLARAERFHQALDLPATPPRHLEHHLFAADSRDTPAVLAINQQTGDFHVTRSTPGDGTVTRASALLDERLQTPWTPRLQSPIDWTRVTFLFSDHLGLTKAPEFTDNLLWTLLEEPR